MALKGIAIIVAAAAVMACGAQAQTIQNVVSSEHCHRPLAQRCSSRHR
jgi:hypothetical protein